MPRADALHDGGLAVLLALGYGADDAICTETIRWN